MLRFLCLSLLNTPFMIRVPNVRAETLHILGSCGLHITVAQICESILVAICVIVIFPARRLDRFEEVDRLYV